MSLLACTGCRNPNESVRQEAAPSTDAQNDTRGATRSRREYGSHAQDEVSYAEALYKDAGRQAPSRAALVSYEPLAVFTRVL